MLARATAAQLQDPSKCLQGSPSGDLSKKDINVMAHSEAERYLQQNILIFFLFHYFSST